MAKITAMWKKSPVSSRNLPKAAFELFCDCRAWQRANRSGPGLNRQQESASRTLLRLEFFIRAYSREWRNCASVLLTPAFSHSAPTFEFAPESAAGASLVSLSVTRLGTLCAVPIDHGRNAGVHQVIDAATEIKSLYATSSIRSDKFEF